MDNKELNQIKRFVNLGSLEDSRWTIKCSIFITFFMPGFIFSIASQTNTKVNDGILPYVLFLCACNIFFGIISFNIIKKRPLIIFIYNVFSSIVFTLTFMTIFYYSLYKVAKLTSPLYITFGILGLLLTINLLLYYRYRVLKYRSENISGKPNYAVISLVIIPAIVIGKVMLADISADKENIIVGIVCLFISYAMSAGIAYIMNFIIGVKYRKQIDFTVDDVEETKTTNKKKKH